MLAATLSALKIAAVAYVGLSLLVYFRQARYVYYPDRQITVTPDYYHLPYEDILLTTEDGQTIAAWFVPAPDPDSATILFCHGNGGNISHRLDSIQTFLNMGFNVLIFDYRGYGNSSGKPSEKGTYLDAMAAWMHLTRDKEIRPERIIVFGRSLGGAVATKLATEVNPGALVIESTFTSAPDMAAKMFPFLPVRLVCRFKYDSLSRMKKIKCPILIAHSPEDEMIPAPHGQRLFEAANEPKLFVEMSGDHNTGGLDTNPEYQRTLKEFVQSLQHVHGVVD